MEAIEPELRDIASKSLSRGNIQAGLSLSTSETKLEAVVNREALDAVLALKRDLAGAVSEAPLNFDSLLSVRGLVEFREPEESPDVQEARNRSIVEGFGVAISALKAMRQREGASLFEILSGQIDRIEALTSLIEADPSRQPEQIRARLAAQIALIADGCTALDRDRLHTEAVLLATKADLREEVDRLTGHVAAARELLGSGQPVGRKLDFLAQEFNRESNTICSKSNASAVTAAGIELKVVIDQFREQVQNLE
jgi:uncharacterized protein (TIGR00255 family)